MGLLDDAIREHLELKRRRGADPGEIERLEREALGPLRRAGQEVAEAPLQGDQEPGVAQFEEEPDEAWSELPEAPAFSDHGSELMDDADDWETPPREPLGGVGVEPEAAPATPVPTPPEETVAPAAGGEGNILDQETVEHDVEGELAQELPSDVDGGLSEPHPSESDEDMLEETPEFLQDTPDHDRLWFEQRPPRDFDLDG